MRKVIRTYGMDWEERDFLKSLLNLQSLPDFILIDTFDED
jgi:hypothetical protein